MNLSLFIARRYLFSKNNRNAINIISFIAILVLTVSAAALIIVLSVFNGIDEMISERINIYAPDLKIEPAKGKTFSAEQALIAKALKNESVENFSAVLEENVLLKSDYKQMIAVAKGVDNHYPSINRINELIINGEYHITQKDSYGVFGIALAMQLGINIPASEAVSVWIPDRKHIGTMRPESAFRTMHIIPTGIAQVEEEFDQKYLICPLNKLQHLTDRDSNTVSQIELKLKEGSSVETVKKEMQAILGDDYIVKNRAQQYDFLYSVMKSEKFATFLILSFIILIAGFSITGSIIILIIEKKEDMRNLLSMGIHYRSIQKIFLFQGVLISGIAAVTGLLIGGSVTALQDSMGFIGYAIDNSGLSIAYPVQLRLWDFIYSFAAVMGIGSLISAFPLMRIRRFLTT